jgi:hypothetical protein
MEYYKRENTEGNYFNFKYKTKKEKNYHSRRCGRQGQNAGKGLDSIRFTSTEQIGI